MSEIINLNSKRPPVVYRVTIVHHYDDTLEFMVEDVADDPRSREAVMSAFRRISGADEEIERLEAERDALSEENMHLREELKPIADTEIIAVMALALYMFVDSKPGNSRDFQGQAKYALAAVGPSLIAKCLEHLTNTK